MHKPTQASARGINCTKTMDETITGQDSATIETPVEETTIAPELEINLDEEIAEPQVETVPKSQYSQVFARMKKAEEALRANTKKPLEEKHDDIRSTVAELKLAETKRQFGYENGLSPEETDFVFKINGKPTKDALEDVAIKGALQAIRSQKKVADNIPRASRSSGFQLPTKKTPLSTDEKEEAYEKYKKEKLG
jgi:hypothetical protein